MGKGERRLNMRNWARGGARWNACKSRIPSFELTRFPATTRVQSRLDGMHDVLTNRRKFLRKTRCGDSQVTRGLSTIPRKPALRGVAHMQRPTHRPRFPRICGRALCGTPPLAAVCRRFGSCLDRAHALVGDPPPVMRGSVIRVCRAA